MVECNQVPGNTSPSEARRTTATALVVEGERVITNQKDCYYTINKEISFQDYSITRVNLCGINPKSGD